MDLPTGEKTNLTKEFQDTDRTIQKIRWKTYGPQKLFDTKLRFRIRLDDFRGYLVTSIEEGNADEQGGNSIDIFAVRALFSGTFQAWHFLYRADGVDGPPEMERS